MSGIPTFRTTADGYELMIQFKVQVNHTCTVVQEMRRERWKLGQPLPCPVSELRAETHPVYTDEMRLVLPTAVAGPVVFPRTPALPPSE